jgi:Fe-S cluster assembly protein SufB
MAVSQEEHLQELSKGYRFDWKDADHSVFEPKRGLSPAVVEEISALKSEPDWMRKFRLKALKHFERRPMPWWGADLSDIDFDNIYYFIRSTEKQAANWDELPEDIKGTWDKLGIPEAEKKYLGGVSAQYESEVVYHKIKKELDDIGVLFTDMDSALGVQVDIPLQAYFRINAENMGQFERTLIIADEGSYVHYVEGCSAPIYTTDSLHSAVVEIIAKKGARVRYTTIQNWSTNVYNLVTKRAAAYEDAVMEWIDGNIGSKVTMKYPSIYLLGKGARGEVLSVAYAGKGMHTDAGGKAIHAAPYTTSVLTSKSVSKDGGRTGYRGLVRIEPGAHHAKSNVRCDALILDEESRSDTYPYVEVEEETAQLGHEASVSRIGEDQLFYLMSRGLSEAEASAMIVNGFIEPITRELPMEYAVELNRLVELQMEGSIG